VSGEIFCRISTGLSHTMHSTKKANPQGMSTPLNKGVNLTKSLSPRPHSVIPQTLPNNGAYQRREFKPVRIPAASYLFIITPSSLGWHHHALYIGRAVELTAFYMRQQLLFDKFLRQQNSETSFTTQHPQGVQSRSAGH
jgi:hypothetical protein